MDSSDSSKQQYESDPSTDARSAHSAAHKSIGVPPHRSMGIRERSSSPESSGVSELRIEHRPIASLALPSLNADIIDNGVVQGDTDYIIRVGGVMLGVSLVQVVCTVIAVYFAAKTSMGFGRDVRSSIFRRVAEFSSREVTSFGAPSLITRNTNDVQQIQMLVMMGLTMMVMAPIMMVGGIIMALREDVGLAWLVADPATTTDISPARIARFMLLPFSDVRDLFWAARRVRRLPACAGSCPSLCPWRVHRPACPYSEWPA